MSIHILYLFIYYWNPFSHLCGEPYTNATNFFLLNHVKPLAFWWIQRSCWSTSQLVKEGMKMPLTLATLAYIWARHKWTESSSIAMAIGMLGILKMRQTPQGNSTMSEDTRCSAIESPFQHPIDPMVDDSTYPTSKTDLGFMIVMNKCKPWLWSRPFALLDLAWNLHTIQGASSYLVKSHIIQTDCVSSTRNADLRFQVFPSLPKQRRRTPLLHLPFKTDTSLLSTKGRWKCQKCKRPIHRLLGKVSAKVDDS